jgi:hypothetical protein
MKFRFRAFVLHLLASAIVLTVVLGTLYRGWYYWPGWYLAGVGQVVLVLAGVDLCLGPLLTLVIASPRKVRHALARDVGIIVAVQLCALVYGTLALWNGRPLYYAFSENVLQLVQAYDVDPHELAVAQEQHLELAPHWYSVPRWIWAPLPQDANEAKRIMSSAIAGGVDVISMPRYFKHWDDGLPEMRKQLQKLDDSKFFSPAEKSHLKERMQDAGVATDQPDTIALLGRGRPLLVVFDVKSLKIAGIFKPT